MNTIPTPNWDTNQLKPLRRAVLTAVLLALICLSLPTAQAAPGDLDPTFAGFGLAGVVVPAGLIPSGLALQPDGKIVVVGNLGSNTQLAVLRYLPDGQPDNTFDGDGQAVFQDMFQATEVAVQRDGRIIVGGRTNGLSFHLARLTPSGGLDASFDGDGWAEDLDSEFLFLEALLVQDDDKIVACGSMNRPASDFIVVRYTSSGSRDTSFGGGDGKVTINFKDYDGCNAIAQQKDGKLVVSGFRSEGIFDPKNFDFAVARLERDGALDDNSNGDGGFDGDGKVITDFGKNERAYAVALQPDGKIVVLGSQSKSDFSFMARYLPNGALDGTFGSGGKLTIPTDDLTELALQPDGKIVALGHHQSPDGDYKVALYRFLSNGAPDPAFNNGGKAWLDFGGDDRGFALALQPDGRILAAGSGGSSGVLIRLWPDGTFDTGGKQTHAIVAGSVYPPGSDEFVYALAVQPDGKLLVADEVRSPAGNRSDAFVTRFLPGGQVDSAFGERGTVYASSGTLNVANAIALQPDGKIVIAGRTGGSGMTDDFLIARFHPNGTVDKTFGDAFGAKTVHFGSGHDTAYALAVTPDGKIVVVGDVFNGTVNIWGVLRLTSAGQPDPSFGPNQDGKVFLHLSNTASVHAVVVQPDGKIVVAGHVDNNSAIARLLANGLPDQSFGTGGATIKDLGGYDSINALVLAPNGWFYSAGSAYNFQNNSPDFALAQFRPDGTLAECADPAGCGHWSSGVALADWGGTDSAFALDWRSDNQLVAAGFSAGRFAAAQFSTTEAVPSPLKFETEFPGGYEVSTGVKFTGSNQIVVAGYQEYNDDWNMALARFETTAHNPGPPDTPGGPSVYLPLILRQP